MTSLTLIAAVAATAVACALVTMWSRRHRAMPLADYLAAVDRPATGAVELPALDAGTFLQRVVRPGASGIVARVGRLTPGAHLERIHGQLLKAGLSSSLRAEEFVAIQVATLAGGAVAAVLAVMVGELQPRLELALFALLVVVGALAPQSWLTRRVAERQERLRRDLPDTLDLLALSVEAGLGFEAAVALVAERLPSPLGTELALTLREMELGRSRRDAFRNLKRRTDVPELSGFVSAVVQADSLGVPIGRVLTTQAAEMRVRRRQWARERANQLPVKILFPLLVFVFPAIFVVIMGPAIGPLKDAFG